MKISPDDHHFEENPNPAEMVFRSDDCNELLEKELTELEKLEKSKNLVSQSSIEIEIKQEGDKTTEKEKKEEYVGESWTLFDVNFGVPLFDADCNTKICQYIKNLTKEEK